MTNPEADFYLTKREVEVLVMMAEGLSQKEIADRLYLSPNTVNTHTQHIYEKMEVHTGPHAVAKAIRARIIE
jgi:DNA-binding CsgD family transcriptional regulator